MKINEEKLKSFIELMINTGRKHNCNVEIETTCMVSDSTRIYINKDGATSREYYVHWPEVSSLTNAAVDIWADFFKRCYSTPEVEYVRRDYASMYNIAKTQFYVATPKIKDVIFNPPATIVFWEDNTKTVVKAENEEFDPEKGLTMAFMKKTLGNKGNYFNLVKKWTEGYISEDIPDETPCIYPAMPNLSSMRSLIDDIGKSIEYIEESNKRFNDILTRRINEIKGKREKRNET